MARQFKRQWLVPHPLGGARIRLIAAALAVLMLILAHGGPVRAQSEEPIGYVQEAQGAALVMNQRHEVLNQRHFRAALVLAEGDAVFEGDRIITGPDGSAQIFFKDGTVLALGPESTLVLDELVYEPLQAGGESLLFSLGPGVFRTVTGEIPRRDPEAFRLETPLGVLGVRGTEIASWVRVLGLVLEGRRPYGEVVREQVPFLAGQPLGLTEHAQAFQEELRLALEGSLFAELHVHAAGSLRRELLLEDRFGAGVLLPRSWGARLRQDQGVQAPGPCDVTEMGVFDFSGHAAICTSEEIGVLNTVRIDRRLSVPREYRQLYGRTMGGGSEGDGLPAEPSAGGGNTGGRAAAATGATRP